MRVGIIGGGFGLKVQAPIIQLDPRFQLTSISTMQRHQVPNELLDVYNPPTLFKNWTEMIDKEELDLLFVSSIPSYHFEMVKYAIEKGIHVVCEKPFTMNSGQSEQLLALTKQSQSKVIIDFEWRYLAIRQKVKELIRNNMIGEILHFDYHISTPQYQYLQQTKIGWMGKKEHFGGILGALGTHMIDCLRWLLNDEIATINGLLHTHVSEGAKELRDADDVFFIHGIMKKKATFSIQAVSAINHGYGSEIKIYGRNGTITVLNDKQLCLGLINEQLNPLILPPQDKATEALSKEASLYYPAFYTFLDKVYQYIAFNKKDEDLPTALDGHQNQLILDKILSQSKICT